LHLYICFVICNSKLQLHHQSVPVPDRIGYQFQSRAD